MTQAKKMRSWMVSLHGELLARMSLPGQFGGNVDLAVEAALLADHAGVWTAVKDSAISVQVDDEGALENVNVVSCRPADQHNWAIVLEATIKVRAQVTVQAFTAHEAKEIAETESAPFSWHLFVEGLQNGSEVLIETAEVLESVHANNVTEA